MSGDNNDQTAGPPSADSPKTRIAILGGGCGGIATAFWLTSTAALRARYDVTLYTQGWRLGGKGASGRDQKLANRIKEHGLHQWLGCYHNAFRMIRDCYDEWQPDAANPFQKWTDAFTPQRQLTLSQRNEDQNTWEAWTFTFPPLPGTPGDGAPTLVDLVEGLAAWLEHHMTTAVLPRFSFGDAIADIGLLRLAVTGGAAAAEIAAAAIAAITAPIRALLRDGEEAQRLFGYRAPEALILADLGLTLAIGVLTDVLPIGTTAFDRLNERDFRTWLASHGADEVTLASAPVRALYDLTFAYPNGDPSDFRNGRVAAGVTVRFVLEMAFGYRDSPLWRLNAGMGDTVFTPLHQVLRARGVQFAFFHRVAKITPTNTGEDIASVTLLQQATVLSEPYDPYVWVDGLDCWPDQPRWELLENGAALAARGVDFESSWEDQAVGAVVLQYKKDFDLVVLALPPEMLKTTATDLATSSTAWAAMIDNSASIPTQAFQLWIRKPFAQLGWNSGSTVMTAYAEPFDSWADMSHILARESWQGPDQPKAIAYFCGTMPKLNLGPLDPIGTAIRQVEANATAWLDRNIGWLWPIASSDGKSLDSDLVVASYTRANVDPSELYVQTLPGSVKFRLAPDAKPYRNLYLAGDWTLTRFSGGSVECAVESGVIAAQAICA